MKAAPCVWGGVLKLGNNSSFNRYGSVSCNNKVTIGNDFLAGWNVSIRDSDNHRIWHNGIEESTVHEVCIGEHVWVCANVDIIKGSIMNDTVVSMNSLVNKEFCESNVLIAGMPARIVKRDIHWER